MTSVGYVVRGFTVPARVLTLLELSEEVAERLSVARALFRLEEESSFQWSVAVNTEALAALWRMYLDSVLRPVLETYCRSLFGGADCTESVESLSGDKLVVYLEGLADIIAYAMRYPLYRDPLASLAPGEMGRGYLAAPHASLLAARLGYAVRRVTGGVDEHEAKRRYLSELMEPVTSLIREGGAASEMLNRIASILAPNARLVELLFYAAPADTRPGFNTSSLFAHLLLVSGIASTAVRLAVGDERPCLDHVLVRLAGLLHDIGKPVDYSRHVDASVNEARRLLEDLVPGRVLEAVIELIRAHHGRGVEETEGLELCTSLAELQGFLRCADGVAAQLDRLGALIEASLSGRLGDDVRSALLRLGEAVAQAGCGSAEEAVRGLYSLPGTKCRPRLYVVPGELLDAFTEATEALSKLLASLDRRTALREAGVLREELPISACRGASDRVRKSFLQLRLYVVDIGGVQAGLSESYRLRSLAGFSLLVDQFTMSGVPGALIEAGAALEGIVFSGGGTVHALIAGGEDEVHERLAEALQRVLGSNSVVALALYGLRVRLGSAPLVAQGSGSPSSRVYAAAVTEAYQGLQELDLGGRSGYSILYRLIAPLGARCDSCGIRPVVLRLGDEDLCPVCAAKYIVADDLSYSPDSVRAAILEDIGRGEHNLAQAVLGEGRYSREGGGIRLMELLAGDYLPGMDALPNYAVLKSDGNAAGAFMSLSLTPAMFFERSVRLDMATKKAIERIALKLRSKCLDSLREGLGVENPYCMAFASFVLGFLYAGGDDSLLIVPARLALPVAALLLYEFSAELGFHASLSTGIAAAPVKHNVWWVLSAANALLDDVAKERARPASVDALRRAEPVRGIGYVAFEYTDGWGLLAARALRRYEERRRLRRSLQPLQLLPEEEGGLSLLELLVLASGKKLDAEDMAAVPRGIPDSYRIDASIRGLLLEDILSAFLEGEAAERMRRLNARLSRAVSPAAEAPENLLRIVYYTSGAKESVVRDAAAIIASVYALKRALPLDDLYLVYKYARGG